VALLRGHVDRTDTPRRTIKGISNLALIQRETGISFDGATVLEVGIRMAWYTPPFWDRDSPRTSTG
jgi:hypothetical protein